jgi:cell division protein FtsI (penicillin-binding protein 3)
VSDAAAREVRELQLAGITLEDQFVRQNPSGGLARAVVGSAYADGTRGADGGQGRTGVERAYERQLEGTPGRLTFEKDRWGNTIAGTPAKLDPAKPGTDLYLTLDQSLQYATEDALTAQVEATGAKQGMAIITRPSTGEVLAMASVAADDEGQVRNTGDNRPVSTVFEPGSVNKMITVAGAMEEGLIDPETPIDVPYQLLVGDHWFSDHDPHPTTTWSPTDILVTSSNIGTIKIAQMLGKEKVDGYLRDFGLGRSTEAFPGEVNGFMTPVDEWSSTEIGAVPIGQGIAVTALQMLGAYNVIANDGVYVAPRLIAATDTGEGKELAAPSDRHRVVSAETATAIRQILAKVVTDGTGKRATVPGYVPFGKTGTARIPQPPPHADPTDAYQDAAGRYHYESSFVGGVDGADLSIIVTIQDAQTSIFGGDVAAPVFAHLASLALRHEQIPPPALLDASAAAVPELSASARELGDEDPGSSTPSTQG